MASKRMKNQLYWLSVKALAAAENELINPFFGELMVVRCYRRALQGAPDRELRRWCETYENRFGPHRKRDLHDARLWPARTIMDEIREEASR